MTSLQNVSFFPYRAYGLSLASDTPLPELNPGCDLDLQNPDVRVRFSGRYESLPSTLQWLPLWTLPSGAPWLSCAKYAGGYLLRFPNLADFSVDAPGQEIVCVAPSETPADTLRHLLLDQVLPLVLNLKGWESLHATAVLTEFGVCAFAGTAGTGKSTLAASFLIAGYSLMSDDCLVLEQRGEEIVAWPGYPGVRLWEDACRALTEDNDRFLPVAHYTSKKRLVTSNDHRRLPKNPQQLACIFSLTRLDEAARNTNCTLPAIEKLSAREAFMELVQIFFRLDIKDPSMLARQFSFTEQVVSRVPVRRLHIPDDFTRLSTVREVILAHLQTSEH